MFQYCYGKPSEEIEPGATTDNHALKSAIQTLHTDPGDDARDALFVALNRANYLVPVLADDSTGPEPKSSGRGLIISSDYRHRRGHKKYRVYNIFNGEGYYMPLFTDREALLKYAKQPVDAITFTSPQAWDWVLQDDLSGAIINPAAEAVPLSLGLIKFLVRASERNFSGCSDPNYIAYVDRRLAFYEKLDRERYEETKSELQMPFEELGFLDKQHYLNQNTVLSVRFDQKSVAMKHIEEFEFYHWFPFFGEDAAHQTRIARGWLALMEGKEDEAIEFLMASTKTDGSPVLNSFGPDVTLIRELYQRGRNLVVVKYLHAVQSFWNTENALDSIQVWEEMIASNCPVQFQFYDTTVIASLNLNDNAKKPE